MPVLARVAAYPDREFNGKVTAMNPSVDPSSRVFILEARFDNPRAQLRPGMFATAHVLLPGGENAVFVPRSAVIRDKTTDSYQVFTIENGTAHLRVVVLGDADGDHDPHRQRPDAAAKPWPSAQQSDLFDGAAGGGHRADMHALAQLCVRRPVFATMLILSLVVVGIFSYFSLGVDLFPKVDIPTVLVIIANPGASPEEIETEITKKVEDTVNTISQVDEVRSTSSEGQSLVIITFVLSKNGDVAAQEVQNKVNLIVPQLPQTAKQPVMQKFDPDAAPILQIAVSAPRSLRDVTLIADKQIKQKLENAKGVGEITIRGRRAPRDPRAGGSGPPALLQPDHQRRVQCAARAESGTARRQSERGREGIHGAHHRARYRFGAVQPDHRGHAQRLRGEGPRHRLRGRQLRRAAQRRAPGRRSGGDPGGGQAVGRKHRGHGGRSETAARRRFPRRCRTMCARR